MGKINLSMLARGILIEKEYYDPEDQYDVNYVVDKVFVDKRTSKFTFIATRIIKAENIEANFNNPSSWIMLEEGNEKQAVIDEIEKEFNTLDQQWEDNQEAINGSIKLLGNLQDWVDENDFHEGLFAILLQ